ncbi:hypothetical protein [Kribbella sp. CA-294648]|uniref:hypothetical protein n=1 Tax=Kribbella sp. CA-294648 TaxID=3239948 RepID=UPI003D8F1935
MVAEMTPGAAVQSQLLALVDSKTAELLYAHCTRGGDYPLGYGHVQTVAELISAELSDSELQNLEVYYVCKVSQAVIIDATVDGQQRSASDIALVPLLDQICLRLLVRVLDGSTPGLLERTLMATTATAADYSAAVAIDVGAWDQHANVDLLDDETSMWGRSNPVLGVLSVLRILRSLPVDLRVDLAIKKFLVAMQRADDLSDWRDDYIAGRLSPVVRSALANLSRANGGAAPNLNAMERWFYLANGYTAECHQILVDLTALSETVELEFPNALRFSKMIQRLKADLSSNLDVFRSERRR